MSKTLISTLTALLILSGCGGSTDETESQQSSVKTAYYIDAPVQNVNYVCGTQTGTTAQDGSFKYEDGSTCQLSIGNITLKEIPSEVLDVNPKFFENNLSIAQLLQSLDADSNISNGITITEEEKEILKDYTSITVNDIPAIISEINSKTDLNLSVIDAETAKTNLYNTITNEVKQLLANQTFYVPIFEKETNKYVIDEVTFDENATQITIKPYNYEGETETDTIDLNGTKVTVTDTNGNSEIFYFNEYNDKYVSLSSTDEAVKLFYNVNDAEEYIKNIDTSIVGTYGGVLYYSDYTSDTFIKSGYIKFEIYDNNTGKVTLYLGNRSISNTFNIDTDQYYPINTQNWEVGNLSYAIVAKWTESKQSIIGWIDVGDINTGYVIYFYNFSAGR